MSKLIIGNWKMNVGVRESLALARAVLLGMRGKTFAPDVVVCPPSVALTEVRKAVAHSRIGLGAQNLFFEDVGAYTGEISGRMLAEIGCGYVIVGHSERRNLFGETDEIVKNKVLAALRHRLIPIVCVGENEEERKCGEAEKVVERQLRMALDGVRFSPHGCVIAYEPVWAIGTGNAGNPADVVRIHTTIWRILSELMERTLVDSVRIVYGGSINSGNSYAFLREQAIDGLLVGGASVKISQWSEILHTATQVIESQQ